MVCPKIVSARAELQLAAAGVELVQSDPVFDESTEPDRAVRELKAKEWDFLIVNIINWIDSREVFRILREFRNEPMVLYSFGGFTDENGTLISPAAGAGSTYVRYALKQWGFKQAHTDSRCGYMLRENIELLEQLGIAVAEIRSMPSPAAAKLRDCVLLLSCNLTWAMILGGLLVPGSTLLMTVYAAKVVSRLEDSCPASSERTEVRREGKPEPCGSDTQR